MRFQIVDGKWTCNGEFYKNWTDRQKTAFAKFFKRATALGLCPKPGEQGDAQN